MSSTITVTFTTDDTNAVALRTKVVAGVVAMLNGGGLDHHPTEDGGPFHDLFVVIADSHGTPFWASEYDGAANNESAE